MTKQRYPFFIELYKGEGHILVVPLINHFGGYRVECGSFVKIENMEDCVMIGDSLLKMADIIKSSGISHVTPKERNLEAVWKKNSKYKSWDSFWKNNNYALFRIYEDGHYKVYSAKRSQKRKGNYEDSVKTIDLPPTASKEEIGKAVIDVFKAAEEYHKSNPIFEPCHTRNLELLDGSILTIKRPEDKHFNDCEDGHVAEIYQCYCYIPKEGAESSAEFFVGTAPELDCNLDAKEIHSSWEDFYGKADFFEVQEADYGIFKLRIEMKNKDTHKISYILQMKEDLLLECGMDVHQPNRRKKLDEKLVELFIEFTLSCKISATYGEK